MTDAEDKEQERIVRTRQDIETSKERAILYREWGYFGLVVLVGVAIIWALWSWKKANDVIGAADTKLSLTLDRINEKLDTIDTGKINQRLDDLGESQRDLNGILSQAKDDIHREFNDLHSTHGTLNAQIAKFGGVTDEVKRQVQQNGDAVHTVALSADRLINDQQVQIRGAEQALTRAAEGLSTMLETDNPKIARILDNLNTVTIDADGTVKGFQPVEQHLAGALAHLEGISADSEKKWHDILYPPPVKGFWPNVKRIFSYVAEPIITGGRVYFTLHSLSSYPVRLVAPIPK